MAEVKALKASEEPKTKNLVIGLADGGDWYRKYVENLLASFDYQITFVTEAELGSKTGIELDLLVFSIFGERHKQFSCLKLLVCGEARIHGVFCDLHFHTCRNGGGIHVPHYLTSFFERSTARKELLTQKKVVQGEKKRFCAFMYQHDVPFRNSFFEALSKYKSVDALGKCCRNTNSPLDRFEGNFYDTAVERYKDYKFVIAFENSAHDGYITEKIINPMLAFDDNRPPAIPIYWGAPDVAKHFNPKSFINVTDCKTLEEAVARVVEIDSDEEKYRAMLAEPWLAGDNPCFNDLTPTRALGELINSRLEIGACYCINLPSAINRRKYCEMAAALHEIPIEFIEAIDGRKIQSECPTYRRLPGELGCLLSHIQALERFVASEQNLALILEDDFELRSDFHDSLRRLSRCWDQTTYGVLALAPFVADWKDVKKISNLDPLTNIYKLTPNIWGCLAYLITRELAIEILTGLKGRQLTNELSETEILHRFGGAFISTPLAIEMGTESFITPGREQDGKKYWDNFRKTHQYTRQMMAKVALI